VAVFPLDSFGNIVSSVQLIFESNTTIIGKFTNEYRLETYILIPAQYVTLNIKDNFTGISQSFLLNLTGKMEAPSKPEKKVELNVWIVEGSGVTQNDVKKDVEKANEIYGKAAKACNFTKRIKFVIKKFNVIKKDKWRSIAGSDNRLDVGVMDERSRLPDDGDNSTIEVYYVPGVDYNSRDSKTGVIVSQSILGVSWEGNKTGVAVSNKDDFDDRTLVHELAHQLSDGAVVDQGVTGSNMQGANKAGNLMNYDNTGDEITKKQAELIEKTLKDL